MVVETPLENTVPSKKQTRVLVYYGKQGSHMGRFTKKVLCKAWMVMFM